MKKLLFAAAALVMMSSVAHAVPINTGTMTFGGGTGLLKWEAEDAGSGLTRYKVFLDDPADAELSWFLQNLGFTGNINQDQWKAGKIVITVDDNQDAVDTDDPPNYTAGLDSFFFRPFTLNPADAGITDDGPGDALGQRTYAITAGSGGITPENPGLDLVQIAQIVAAGDVSVSGAIARAGAKLALDPPTAGNFNNTMTPTPIPEPSTLVLLGLGAVGLVGFARKRRKSA